MRGRPNLARRLAPKAAPIARTVTAAPKLVPPDLERCQGEKSNGAGPFTIGGAPRMERCKAKPLAIVTEREPGPDGQTGSMSLCSSCVDVLKAGKGDPRGYLPVWFRAPRGELLLCPFCAHASSAKDTAIDVLQLEPDEDFETTCPACRERFAVDVAFEFTVRALEGKKPRAKAARK